METTVETIIVYLTPEPTAIPTPTPTFTPLPSYTPLITDVVEDLKSVYDSMSIPMLNMAFWIFMISLVIGIAVLIIKVVLSQR